MKPSGDISGRLLFCGIRRCPELVVTGPDGAGTRQMHIALIGRRWLRSHCPQNDRNDSHGANPDLLHSSLLIAHSTPAVTLPTSAAAHPTAVISIPHPGTTARAIPIAGRIIVGRSAAIARTCLLARTVAHPSP